MAPSASTGVRITYETQPLSGRMWCGIARCAATSCRRIATGKGRSASASPWTWPISRRPTRYSRPPNRCGSTVTPGQLDTSRRMRSPALFASLREPALARAIVSMILRIDLPHRVLAAALFVRVRDEPRQPRDEEDRVAEFVCKSEVGGDRGDRTVDVDRQRPPERLFAPRDRPLGCAQQPDVLALELEL